MQLPRRKRGDGLNVFPTDFLTDVAKTALGVVAGTVISMVITGFMVNHFVVRRIMRNKDVQDIIKMIHSLKDEIMEANKNGKNKTLPEASDYKHD
jgi:hypothetical protein